MYYYVIDLNHGSVKSLGSKVEAIKFMEGLELGKQRLEDFVVIKGSECGVTIAEVTITD